jgi:hypothetical protein
MTDSHLRSTELGAEFLTKAAGLRTVAMEKVDELIEAHKPHDCLRDGDSVCWAEFLDTVLNALIKQASAQGTPEDAALYIAAVATEGIWRSY